MINREDIRGFLIKQKDSLKDEVLMNFVQWALANGVIVDHIGKLVADLRSYKEWTWGE